MCESCAYELVCDGSVLLLHHVIELIETKIIQ